MEHICVNDNAGVLSGTETQIGRHKGRAVTKEQEVVYICFIRFS